MTKLQIEELGKLVGEMSEADLTFDADEIVETGQELFAEVCRLSERLMAKSEPMDKKTIDVLAKWNRLLVRIDTKLLNGLQQIRDKSNETKPVSDLFDGHSKNW